MISNRTKLATLVLVAVLAIGAVAGYFTVLGGGDGAGKLSGKEEPVISENVVVYSEGESPFTIIASDDDSVIVSSMDGIAQETILCSDVTDQTPNGLLRKIEAINEVAEGYRLTTKPAALTDAIKKCDVTATVRMNADGTYTLVEDGVEEGSPWLVQKAFASDLQDFFSFDSEFIRASAGLYFDVSLKIEDFKVDARIVAHFRAGADLGALAGQIEEELFSKELQPFTFMVGSVPVVLTNHFNVTFKADAEATLLQASASYEIDKAVGIEYTTDGGLKGVCEDNSHGEGFKFEPESNLFSMSLDAVLEASLGTYLYGFAGPNISLGADNDVELALQKLPDGLNGEGAITLPGIDWKLRGRLLEKLTIPISGHFKIQVPAPYNPFDSERDALTLVDAELFNTGDAITLIDLQREFGADGLPKEGTVESDTGDRFVFYYPEGWECDSSDRMFSFVAKGDLEVRFVAHDSNEHGYNRLSADVGFEKVSDASLKSESGERFTVSLAKSDETFDYGYKGATAPAVEEFHNSYYALVPESWNGTKKTYSCDGIVVIPFDFGKNVISATCSTTDTKLSDADIEDIKLIMSSFRKV